MYVLPQKCGLAIFLLKQQYHALVCGSSIYPTSGILLFGFSNLFAYIGFAYIGFAECLKSYDHFYI